MFLQIAIILLLSRLVGLLMKRMGQPQVIGEILTGIALGPSLLGLFFPQVQHALFPKESVDLLKSLSSIGLVLFMFLVGLELDMGQIRKMYHKAISISLGGILFPLLLGVGAGALLLNSADFFPPTQDPLVSVAFLGVAMSVTAFPVLARILSEFRMTRSRIGSLALASAAIDDLLAWMLLAVVMILSKGTSQAAIVTGLGIVGVSAVSFLLLRPLLAKLAVWLEEHKHENWILPIWMVLLLLLASVTEAVGMHFIMGAFILGLITPRGWIAEQLEHRIAPLATQLFLPIFFVISGLNTQVNLLSGWHAWMVAGGIILVASLGKLLGCGYVAWRSGETPGDALTVAGLMNARGLMELVVLNIGLQMGLISPLLFSIMVVMTVVTTVLATPLFRLGTRWNQKQEAQVGRLPVV
ncbi:cation:proton antiporter [Deinococcus cellulosilyticus]|nr:cation:proton antiporter [Deinococcus cellulosilyticus]